MKQHFQLTAGLVALSVLLAGCGAAGGATAPTTGAIVDGFPLGPALSPVPSPDIEPLAAAALDQRVPGHASIVSAMPYQEDIRLVYSSGSARSGTMTVYVFRLADGSWRAAGVYCSVAGCAPWPVYRP